MLEEEDRQYEELVSSSDGESENETPRHDELLKSIYSIGQKRKLEQREEPSQVVSEFHLSTKELGQLEAHDLLSALSNKKGVRQLQQRLTKVDNKATHLLKPLASVEKDRLQRKVAFGDAAAKVSKWEAIVKYNRKAEHLRFPVQDEVPPRPSLSARAESFEPRTEMELEVAAVLSKSQHNLPSDQELTEAEKKALLKLSLEEAKERRAELRKMRSLVSAYEHRQRRINRIKSKKFHKTQRKIKEKVESRRMVKTDVMTDEDQLLKAERMRARERATLKHSRMSKWAKEQLARKHHDPSVRLALTEQSSLKKQLKHKISVEHSSSEEENVVTESEKEEEEEDPTPLIRDPDNPWLQNEVPNPVLLLDSNLKTESGNIPRPPKRSVGDLGDLSSKDNLVSKSCDKKELESDLESGDEERGVDKEPDGDERKDHHNGVTKNKSKSRPHPSLTDVIDPHKLLKSSDIRKSKLAQAAENLLAVQEAFAGDDVVEEFLKEKEKDIEDGKPKKEDSILPGWGSWAGLGVKEKRKRKAADDEGPEKDEDDEGEDRKDVHLKYVIINHRRDKKAAKHMVSKLPYPLTDGIQFKKMMATPIGRDWNTETRFSKLIRPRVETAIGSNIQPMRMTDEVQKFMKDATSRDRKKRLPSATKRKTSQEEK